MRSVEVVFPYKQDVNHSVEGNIYCLPPELLAVVFTFAHTAPRPVRVSASTLPIEFTLGQVSRLWRDIARTTPALWSKICLKPNFKFSIPRARRYIRRSGTVPLDIFLECYEVTKQTHPTSGRRLVPVIPLAAIQLILDNLHHLGSLIVRCYDIKSAMSFQEYFKDLHAPTLRSSSIEYNTFKMNIPEEKMVIFQAGTPRLTELTTELPNILPSKSSLRNLTSLSLCRLNPTINVDFGALVGLLRSLPTLLHLSLEGQINAPNLNQPILILPKLLSLRFLGRNTMPAQMILLLEAPNLESLWMNSGSSSHERSQLLNAPEMADGRKFPKLKYLTIRDNFTTAEQLCKVFPSVTHLHYTYVVTQWAPYFAECLIKGWDSVHTVVLSNFIRSRFNSRDEHTLADAWATVLSHCRAAGRPIKRVLVDIGEEVSYWHHAAANPECRIRVETLNTGNYQDHWWKLEEERRLWGVDLPSNSMT